jgi:hypothetical protein
VLAAVDGLYGAGLLVRRSDDARYLAVLSHWPIPLTVYAVLLVGVSMLLFARRLVVAGSIGAMAWMTFAVASLLVYTPGIPPAPDGAILSGGFAAFHWLIAYGAARGLSPHTKNDAR